MKAIVVVASLGILASPKVASGQIPQQLPPAVITDTSTNSVTVQNNRKAPVSIYLKTGTFDRRLGVVPPMEIRTLPLPAWAVTGFTTVRLVAHPEDQVEDLGTEYIRLRPPGRVGMIVKTPQEVVAPPPKDTMMEIIPPEELANATLTVDNPRDVPVTVFASAGLYDVRLGQVPAKQRATLRFPKSVVSPFRSIQVFVRPQNGRDLGTEEIRVKEGEHLALRVPQS